jgi:hypothetical protein
MALLSDIDWLIILAVGGFLLIGKGDPQLLRTLGRWYAKAMSVKQQLLSEVTRAAELPTPAPGQPTSIRSALLGLDVDQAQRSQVPIAVARPPLVLAPMALATASVAAAPIASGMTWVNSVGPQQWSVASTHLPELDGGMH